MSQEFIQPNISTTLDFQAIGKNVDGFESGYQRYLELGGIINKKDYESALDGIDKTRTLDRRNPSIRHCIQQALHMAGHSGISLNDLGDVLDLKILLYAMLRNDTKPEAVEYHHSQMTDQRLFGEVLLMLGDADSFEKLTKAYPNISFK